MLAPQTRIPESIWIWGVLALAGLSLGIWFASFGPAHSESYFEVRWWLEEWISGQSVYGGKILVDYPPNALFLLRPLAWLPKVHGEVFWAFINAALTVGCAWILVSITERLAGNRRLTRVERAPFALMLIAWAPTRVNIWNGQNTPLILLMLGLGIRLADSSPILAGIALGLGISKPHMAIPFLVLAAFQRRWRTLAVAAATAVGLALLYCASVSMSPVAVFRDYVGVLLSVYGGPRFLRAEVDMRPLWADLFGNYGVAEPLFLTASAVLGAWLLHLTWRKRHISGAADSVFSAWLIWTLSVFPFRRYGLMLMAPPVLFLLWRPGLRASLRAVTAMMVVMLVVDVPWFIRHIVVYYDVAIADGLVPIAHHLNRIAILLLLSISIVLLSRGRRRSTAHNGEPDVIATTTSAPRRLQDQEPG